MITPARLIASWSDRRTYRNRLVKPLAFWVGVANVIIVASVLRNVAFGAVLDGPLGEANRRRCPAPRPTRSRQEHDP